MIHFSVIWCKPKINKIIHNTMSLYEIISSTINHNMLITFILTFITHRGWHQSCFQSELIATLLNSQSWPWHYIQHRIAVVFCWSHFHSHLHTRSFLRIFGHFWQKMSHRFYDFIVIIKWHFLVWLIFWLLLILSSRIRFMKLFHGNSLMISMKGIELRTQTILFRQISKSQN